MSDKVIMPRELTAENGAKALMMGEFFETIQVANPDYCDDETSPYNEEPETLSDKVTISWTSIKGIYKKAVEHFAKPVKPIISPERLAEILLDYDLQLQKLMHSAPTFDDFKKAKIGLATDLLKALDIREKEQPCCDSPGKERCMQCQELDRRD
jgi:hypothetical protein